MAGYFAAFIFLGGMGMLELGRKQLTALHLCVYPQGARLDILLLYQRSAP